MKIFNSDDLPEPKTILEATADAVNLAAEQRAREAYDKHMKEVNLGTIVGLFLEIKNNNFRNSPPHWPLSPLS